MRGRHRFALLCTSVLTLSTAAPASSPAAEIGYRVVSSGSTFGAAPGQSDSVARIVRDRRSTAALLAEWSMQPLRPGTKIDFRRRSLIVVLAREWPDSGYVILPASIVVQAGTAAFTGTVFRRGGIGLDAFARPFVIVSVPRAAVAKVAAEVPVTLRCAQRVRCSDGVS